ncbi:AAA family ATPase [Helicobacter cetorum]|uniref:Chaperone protein ClpB n=1 Tax=Helicobacter cetorum (strain ATCC BAA-429 / MIT 00-7128) TaxID=182217 RepID=I0ELV1_HELC0|nr:AAA family ATPase [Helicobacter cetorum]AFI03920.1 ATPase AAA-2 domain-containing protein [Helicobacter cetorum MIT 00-7128]
MGIWLENFERECMLKRALILSGNTIDLVFSKKDELLPFKEVMVSSLKNQGFEHVISYSLLNGVEGISASEWSKLQNIEVEAKKIEEGESDYDIGESPNEPNKQESNNSTIKIDMQNFLQVAQRVFANSTKSIVFVIDFANYLFGQINSLSEKERAYLQQIASSLRDAKKSNDLMSPKPRPLIIFMNHNDTTLPPSLYLNNPNFKEISIPLPNLEEREKAILKNAYTFKIKGDLRANSIDFNELVVGTDSLSLLDIENLARLSRMQDKELSIKELLSLYRFGTKDSPWEKLNYERLKTTKETLKKRVKGQDKAIQAIDKILLRAYTGLSGLQHSSQAKSPKGALFFVGPTGVGKTELAKSLAEFLFGEEDACIRFDMSEFNHEHADQRLVGAPPGYVGFEQGGQLTNAVKQKPFCLLLFDETEKAHPRILDKFLQILEDGRLTDGKGETILFSDTFIVFTSNIGAADIDPNSTDTESEFVEAVKRHFKDELKRPEILGRIGEANILAFDFMKDNAILKEIAKAKLNPLIKCLKDKWGIEGLRFEDEDKALEILCEKVNKAHGGRGLLNVLTKEIFDPLAEFLFEHSANKDNLKYKSIQVKLVGKFFDFELV